MTGDRNSPVDTGSQWEYIEGIYKIFRGGGDNGWFVYISSSVPVSKGGGAGPFGTLREARQWARLEGDGKDE